MDSFLGQTKKKIKRRKRLQRREKLMRLLQAILSGGIDSRKPRLDSLFNPQVPRADYTSPGERGDYNQPKVVNISEMCAGTPNEN